MIPSKSSFIKHLLLVLFTIGFTACFLQSGYAQEQMMMLNERPTSTAQSAEGGMWRLDGNFDAVLHLKNVLAKEPLTVHPSLIMQDGTPYALAPVTLSAAGVALIDIGDAVRHMPASMSGHRSDHGMISLSYSWSWGGAVLASVQNVDELAMLSYRSPVQADTARLNPNDQVTGPQRLNGAWWRPYSSTEMFMFLGNTGNSVAEADVRVMNQAGIVIHQESIRLRPHESTTLDLFKKLQDQPISGAVGSVAIRYTGLKQSLVTYGGLEDLTNGFSANLNVVEYHPERARDRSVHPVRIAIPGVMAGSPQPHMQFPQQTTFTPYLVLHNVVNRTRTVSVTASYTASRSRASTPAIFTTLQPGATAAVDLSSLRTVRSDSASLDLEEAFTGNDGDIEAAAGSVDQTGNYVFEAQPQAEGWSASRTLCYWTTSGDNNTMISLWNYTDHEENLVLSFFYEGGVYRLPVQLAAGADLELDVATLIKSRKPDDAGTVIPGNITQGSAMLSGTESESQRIDVASSSATFNVRNGTCAPQCGVCNGVASVSMVPTQVGVNVGASAQATGKWTWNTGYSYQKTTGATWSSNSPTIATVNSSGSVTGMDDGDTSIYFGFNDIYYQPNYCSMGSNYNCPYMLMGGSGPVASRPGTPVVTCTPVIRGGTTICKAAGPIGTAFGSWKFSVAGFPDVLSAAGSTTTPQQGMATWVGPGLTSGNVFVQAKTPDGKVTTVSTVLVVTARNFHISPANPVEKPNGTNGLPTMPIPPKVANVDDGGLGHFLGTVASPSFNVSIVNGGPNSGYFFYNTNFLSTAAVYEINPDLENSSSDFFKHQPELGMQRRTPQGLSPDRFCSPRPAATSTTAPRRV